MKGSQVGSKVGEQDVGERQTSDLALSLLNLMVLALGCTDYTESYVSFLLFLLFCCFNHHNEPCHRHKDISFYHILSTKISPPRMTGKLPASGHWRFRGTMTPSRSKQAAPLAAGHPAQRRLSHYTLFA